MTGISTNAEKLAAKWENRARQVSKAAREGRRNAAIAIDREQVKNLGGGGEAGGYPVPVRTGNLRGGHFFDASRSTFAIVGNTTEYAMAVHTGNLTTRQGLRYSVRPRPFLDDAAEAVDVLAIMAIPIRDQVLT